MKITKIKKALLFAAALSFLVFASPAVAATVCIGYYNSAPDLRLWWNDNIGSEISTGLSYNDSQNNVVSAANLYITPVIWSVYSGQYGRINLSAKFEATLSFNDPMSNVWDKSFRNFIRMHSYEIYFNLPEFEIKMPYVEGLSFIGSMGISTSWFYEDNGQYSNFNVNIFGPAVGNLGFVYYFK
jgi:hypothetical protein